MKPELVHNYVWIKRNDIIGKSLELLLHQNYISFMNLNKVIPTKPS